MNLGSSLIFLGLVSSVMNESDHMKLRDPQFENSKVLFFYKFRKTDYFTYKNLTIAYFASELKHHRDVSLFL